MPRVCKQYLNGEKSPNLVLLLARENMAQRANYVDLSDPMWAEQMDYIDHHMIQCDQIGRFFAQWPILNF
jgi:hypothetical protein